jgi:hypothetical protein
MFTKEQVIQKINKCECLPLGTVPIWYKEHVEAASHVMLYY